MQNLLKTLKLLTAFLTSSLIASLVWMQYRLNWSGWFEWANNFNPWWLCDIILACTTGVFSYILFKFSRYKSLLIWLIALAPYMLIAFFGTIVNYKSLFPIEIPFYLVISFTSILLGKSLYTKKKLALVLIVLTTVSFVKNQYLVPIHYAAIKQKPLPKNNNFNEFISNISILDLDTTVVDNEILKGKVLYIELWFSNCVPCLKKSPAIEKLKKNFNKNEAIEFISMLDGKNDDFATYGLMAKKYADVFTKHYYLDKANIQKMEKYIGLNTYPIELIIDKKGYLKSVYHGYYMEGEDNYVRNKTNLIKHLLENE